MPVDRNLVSCQLDSTLGRIVATSIVPSARRSGLNLPTVQSRSGPAEVGFPVGVARWRSSSRPGKSVVRPSGSRPPCVSWMVGKTLLCWALLDSSITLCSRSTMLPSNSGGGVVDSFGFANRCRAYPRINAGIASLRRLEASNPVACSTVVSTCSGLKVTPPSSD